MQLIDKVHDLSEQIVREFAPERIILFGSYAYGEPDSESDVDVLVVMNHEQNNVYQAIEILNRLNPTFPIDLLVRTPREIEERLALNDMFLRDIVTRGRLLYAATNRGMGRQGRGGFCNLWSRDTRSHTAKLGCGLFSCTTVCRKVSEGSSTRSEHCNPTDSGPRGPPTDLAADRTSVGCSHDGSAGLDRVWRDVSLPRDGSKSHHGARCLCSMQ
ncbi:nucleotidyltransferase domain-containing protein [Candidatus Gracilibacteria bacterium]|nr:nucleotidyltransferase domain-containing protein [Candidatus Gracilibacteria bacterium]